MILNLKNDTISSFDSFYITPGCICLALICSIFLFILPVYALLAFLSLTIIISIGILLYLQNEFFMFLILFIYSGAITVLFIFLLQFYNAVYEHKQNFQNNKSWKIPTLPFIIKTLVGSCFLLLFAEVSSIFILTINIDENWELLNSRIFVEESTIKNLSIIFLENQEVGNITTVIGLLLLVGLVVLLCIIGTNEKNYK